MDIPVTDGQTDISAKWAFTAFEGQWGLFESIPPGIEEWGWQKEICPTSGTPHYQGYLRTSQRQRHSWLRKLLPGVRIAAARNWDALKQYCRKEETRAPGAAPVHVVNNLYNKYSYNEHLFQRLGNIYRHTGIPVWSDEEALIQIVATARVDIRAGHREVAWIIHDPGWRAVVKGTWKDLLVSFGVTEVVE